jgi:hypothetical protein
MAKPNSGQSGNTQKATHSDLRHILGEMDDETAVAILALNPNVAQIEEVNVWLSGGEEVLAKEHRPVDAVVAKILDLVAVEDEEPPPARRS